MGVGVGVGVCVGGGGGGCGWDVVGQEGIILLKVTKFDEYRNHPIYPMSVYYII